MRTLSEFLKETENQEVVLTTIINLLRERGEWGTHGLFRKIGLEIGISPAYVGRALTGKNRLTDTFVLKLASYIHVPVEMLLGEMKGSYEEVKADFDRAAKLGLAFVDVFSRHDQLCKNISGLLKGLNIERLEAVEKYAFELRNEVLSENEESLRKEREEGERQSEQLKADLDARKKRWEENGVFSGEPKKVSRSSAKKQGPKP